MSFALLDRTDSFPRLRFAKAVLKEFEGSPMKVAVVKGLPECVECEP
jgi:hypothetical protein